ncbi:MAG: metallophosphoesterase, partial [Bacteroidota bacterium]
EDQADWLADVLADNPNRWTVVVCHHPVFSTAGRRDNVDQRAAWKPLLDRYGVDLVLQGHDHTYARGRTVNVAAGANLREPVSGTVYVSSVSGPKMYATKDNRWDDYDDIEMERAAENTQLFQVIRVDGDTLSFHAFDVTGQLYDAFDLVKRPNGPNRFLAHPVTTTPERTHENTVPAYDRAGF